MCEEQRLLGSCGSALGDSRGDGARVPATTSSCKPARGRNKDVPHLEGHVPKVAQATGQKGHLAARAAGKVIAF